MSDLGQAMKMLDETVPTKLREMTTEKVIEYEQRFAELLPSFGMGTRDQQVQRLWQARMELLRAEIERRSVAEQTERHHQEVIGVGKKTLRGTEKTVFWSRLAVLAAVIVPVGLYLISELYSSNTRRARRKKASSQTYFQTPTPNTESPVQAANSSSATPSPQQTATAQPSVSPPKSLE